MSLESALDEERREVMDILEGRSSQLRNASVSTSNQVGRTSSPAPPVRSMLDIGDPAPPRHGSIGGIGTGATVPSLRIASTVGGVRSMLDPHSPPPGRKNHSTTTSPTENKTQIGGIHRTQSDASSYPSEGRRRTGNNKDRNIQTNYQFDMSPSIQGQALPKRVTQGGKKQSSGRNAMAAIMQGQELESLPRGRHNSTAGILGGKSKSPSSRLNNRSRSPGGSILNNNSFNLMPTPGTFVTDGGKVIDMSSAYRRLSDANLLKSGGNLSNLPSRNLSERGRLGSGEVLSPTGEVRLQKDYYDDDDERAVESSDEDHSSDDGSWDFQSVRGRRRSRRKKGATSGDADNEDSENEVGSRPTPLGMGKSSGPKMVKSLMAAAEEERECKDMDHFVH